MRISNSIFLSAIVGIAGMSLLNQQAQAVTTTFADANNNNFLGSIDNSTAHTFNFDSFNNGNTSALTDGSLNDGDGQTLTITENGLQLLRITGASFGATPFSGSRQVSATITDNNPATVTFSLSKATNFFGIHLGDQYDIGGNSTFTLTANGTTFLNKTFGGIGNSTRTTNGFNDTADPDGSDNLTVGNNRYNFFGIVDDTNPFTEVTLTFDETGSNQDNFVFDSIIVEDGLNATSVPFEFSPALGLVIVGLGFGSYKYRQTQSNSRELNQ